MNCAETEQPMWRAEATGSTERPCSGSERDHFLQLLAAADSANSSVHWSGDTVLHAVFAVRETTLRRASKLALVTVRDVAAASLRCPLLLTGLFVAECSLGRSGPSSSGLPELVGTSEAAAMMGITRQRFFQLTALPGFPKPVAELACGKVWTAASVLVFEASRCTSPGRPKKSARERDGAQQ